MKFGRAALGGRAHRVAALGLRLVRLGCRERPRLRRGELLPARGGGLSGRRGPRLGREPHAAGRGAARPRARPRRHRGDRDRRRDRLPRRRVPARGRGRARGGRARRDRRRADGGRHERRAGERGGGGSDRGPARLAGSGAVRGDRRAVADALAEADPANEATYAANAEAYVAEIAALDEEFRTGLVGLRAHDDRDEPRGVRLPRGRLRPDAGGDPRPVARGRARPAPARRAPGPGRTRGRDDDLRGGARVAQGRRDARERGRRPGGRAEPDREPDRRTGAGGRGLPLADAGEPGHLEEGPRLCRDAARTDARH